MKADSTKATVVCYILSVIGRPILTTEVFLATTAAPISMTVSRRMIEMATGVVDLVILYIPQEFKHKDLGCGFHGTVIEDYESSQNVFIRYPTADSVSIEGRVLVVFQRPSFPYLVGVAAHEYGHMMDLPELYDRGADSAGIGSWGVMGAGPFGWSYNVKKNLFFGPNPLSVWSRVKVGWITEANGRLKTVDSDTTVATLHDIHSKSLTVKAYKVPVRGSDTEYFLMANRQNTYAGTSSSVGYYEDLAPASGLAIWHIDDDGLPISGSGLRYAGVNNNEKHKGVDLECADGLYDKGGFGTPGNSKNSISGGDNLDYASADTTYTKNNKGNLGDATDLWDGSTNYRHFTPSSNPSTAGYNSNEQNVFSGIAVRNISQTKGVMSFNVRFIPSAPRDLGVAAPGGQTQVTLAWSEPMVNATAISEYQYSIDETNWTRVDGGASTRFVLFDNSTSTTFWVRAVTAHEHGEAAKIALDRPGTVTLSSNNTLAKPTVGDTLTAALTDVNGSISGKKWQWERGTVSGGSWTGVSIAKATDARYNLTVADVGQQVRATVSYMDGAGDNTDTAASLPTSSVVGVPSAPDSLTATPGDKQVVLSWAAADSNGAWIKSYSVQDSTVGRKWSAWAVVSGGGSARTTTRTGLTNGTRYWFAVRATNRLGAGRSDTVSALPAVPKPPTITGRLQPSFAENSTDSVATYQAKTSGGKALSWTLGGTDVSAFRTSGDTLYFKQAPNYEAPTDGGKNNQYDLTIRAVDGTADTTVAVTVSVSNEEERGTIAFTPSQPQAGHPITAQLSDPDSSITGASWQWQPLTSASVLSGTAQASSYPELSSYTPHAADVGKRLVARVSYRDGHGTGKSASDTTVAVVAGAPSAPDSLKATAGDKQVVLRWDAADSNGASIQSYSVRDSTVGSKWSAWAVVSGGGAARTTTRTGLTNGTRYWFGVRATNSAGAGPPDTVSATPQGFALVGPDSVGFAENGTGAVATYQTTPAGGSVTWSVAGTDGSHFTITSGGQLSFRSAPNYERPADQGGNNVYQVQVQAASSVKGTPSLAKAVKVRVTNVEEAGTLSFSPLPPRANRAITATLTDLDSVVTIQRWRWGPYVPGFGGIGATAEATEAAAEATAAAATVSSGHTSTYTPNIFYHRANFQLEVTAFYTDGHGAGKQKRVLTAAVGPPDRAGTIALTTTAPEVGTAVTATLSDGDGSITGASWQWQRRKSSSGTWQDVSSASASAEAATYPEVSSYTPQAGDVGYQLRATVSYRDGYAPNRRVDGAATSAVVDVPDAPGSPKATAGDKQVVLTWTTPANNGSALTGYAYRDSTVGSNKKWSIWQDITGSGATTTTYTVKGLINDTAYWFQVRAKNGVGAGAASDTVSATPGLPKPPTITGRLQPSFAENSTDSVATYQAKTGGGKALSWTLGGTDVSAFRTSGDTLYFKQAPNYEAPTDGGKNNQYDLTIRAVDGKADTTVSVRVSVSNLDEAGTVELSSKQPKVGQHLTASLTSEPDGLVTGTDTWNWTRLSSRSASAEASSSLSDSYRYTVLAEDLGKWLVARVRYTDGHGAGKSASDTTTAAVVADVPGAPGSLTATAGAKQVVLTWTTAANNGSALTGYAHRDSIAGQKWSIWKDMTGSGATTTTHTVTGLINDTAYWFQVRAKNGVGAGAASDTVSATPKAVDKAGTIALTTTAPKVGTAVTATLTDGDGGITGASWQWQRRKSSSETWQNVSSASAETATYPEVSSYTPQAGDIGYQLRATVDYRDSLGPNKTAESAATSAVVADVPGAPTSLTATAGDAQVSLSWSAPASDGGASISRYEYRYKGSGSWSDWTPVGTSTSATVSSLTNNTAYSFEVRAVNSAGNGASASASATPVKVDSPGSVSLSTSQPTVGQSITATLSDADGSIKKLLWSWSYFSSASETEAALDSTDAVATSSLSKTVTPSRSVVGYRLRFTARYDDAHGTGKQAQSAKTSPVQATTPSAPRSLTATAGDAQVSLSWSAPANDGGASISRYEYRYKGSGSWSGWSSVGTSTSTTVSSLTNNTSYSFEVRAVNSAGNGSTASASATPFKSDSPGSVSLSTSQPTVGQSITATLSDADGGIKNLRWSWSYFSGSGGRRNRDDD